MQTSYYFFDQCSSRSPVACSLLFIYCMYVCGHMFRGMCLWRSEDDLWELVFFFHGVCPRDGAPSACQAKQRGRGREVEALITEPSHQGFRNKFKHKGSVFLTFHALASVYLTSALIDVSLQFSSRKAASLSITQLETLCGKNFRAHRSGLGTFGSLAHAATVARSHRSCQSSCIPAPGEQWATY